MTDVRGLPELYYDMVSAALIWTHIFVSLCFHLDLIVLFLMFSTSRILLHKYFSPAPDFCLDLGTFMFLIYHHFLFGLYLMCTAIHPSHSVLHISLPIRFVLLVVSPVLYSHVLPLCSDL